MRMIAQDTQEPPWSLERESRRRYLRSDTESIMFPTLEDHIWDIGRTAQSCCVSGEIGEDGVEQAMRVLALRRSPYEGGAVG
ncbi:hypothetical protein FJTKL_11266 [Diaporthe vaccinii]|uniref:Uncharacterized protein n=1 Tax=Diaporthe vaccinii TaxID=105482 RepID=A0ABR4EH73_9PEZI